MSQFNAVMCAGAVVLASSVAFGDVDGVRATPTSASSGAAFERFATLGSADLLGESVPGYEDPTLVTVSAGSLPTIDDRSNTPMFTATQGGPVEAIGTLPGTASAPGAAIASVPTPGTSALALCAGLIALRRRR